MNCYRVRIATAWRSAWLVIAAANERQAARRAQVLGFQLMGHRAVTVSAIEQKCARNAHPVSFDYHEWAA